MGDTGRTILIGLALAVILIVVICCVAAFAILLLGFTGPSVGNVFSNIITAFPTSTPATIP